MSGEKPTRKRGTASRRKRSGRATRPRAAAWAAAAAGVCVVVAAAAAVLWLRTPHQGKGQAVAFEWLEDAGALAGAGRLARAQVIDRPLPFALLLWATRPLVRPVPGEHLLGDDLPPGEVLRRLVRLSSRGRARVLVPEGVNRFQIGERLEALGICASGSFQTAATDRSALAALGIAGDSAEGYLFPATYELFADSEASAIVLQMVTLAKKRLAAMRDAHSERFATLETTYAFHEREILTLASVVEKEAARDDELPVIASVFQNRLSSVDFRPARSLQSDPTALYGCLVSPGLESCRGYAGKVLPAMLRDADNPYNTYRHPGLPPGPIANPGERAILAVLSPATTEYLFFVASGNGRHTFSRTLEEHESAVHRPR